MSCVPGARTKYGPRFAMLAPKRALAARVFLLQHHSIPPSLDAELDQALSANPHYKYCRDLGQLLPARVARVSCDGAAAYIDACQRRGQRLGDIKASALSSRSGWAEVFAQKNRSE